MASFMHELVVKKTKDLVQATRFFFFFLWWSYNHGSAVLDLHPCICGWKLVVEPFCCYPCSRWLMGHFTEENFGGCHSVVWWFDLGDNDIKANYITTLIFHISPKDFTIFIIIS
jgi:hypothetical protein